MNYTLHLTDYCNLNCKYCYEKGKKNKSELSFENIKKLIDFIVSQDEKNVQITFFGGEPLLRKDIIYDTIKYIKSKKSKINFRYGMTTNGILLDDEILNFMKKNNFTSIGYSIDGTEKVHDLNRISRDGKGSFNIVNDNAKKILKNIKNVVAMVVVTRNNIKYIEESVNYLLELGFTTINLQFDYTIEWLEEDLQEIKEQFVKVGEIYYNKIKAEEDINILLIESKIKTHVEKGTDCNAECTLGVKSVNIGTDGKIYPCMQFVGIEEYVIGDCESGINEELRRNLRESSQKENEICKSCVINKRCKHTCACKNYATTQNINEVSPLVCEIERMTIEIADNVANRLYEENSKLFIQKFYNSKYLFLKALLENKK